MVCCCAGASINASVGDGERATKIRPAPGDVMHFRYPNKSKTILTAVPCSDDIYDNDGKEKKM